MYVKEEEEKRIYARIEIMKMLFVLRVRPCLYLCIILRSRHSQSRFLFSIALPFYTYYTYT